MGRRAASFGRWSRASPSFFSLLALSCFFSLSYHTRLANDSALSRDVLRRGGSTQTSLMHVCASVHARVWGLQQRLCVSVYFERLYAILLSTEEETQTTAKKMVSAFRLITPFHSFSEGGSLPEE